MKTSLANVPRKVIDPNYRYQMPFLKVKVEGKGKMVKTIVENIDEVAKSLERNTEYIMKFFAFDLGVQYSFKNGKHTLGSARSAEELQKILDIFIDKFLLCDSCSNPETVFQISKNQLTLSCKACGSRTFVNYSHRITDFIEKKIIAENKEKKNQQKVISYNQTPVESLKKFWKLDPKEDEIIPQVEIFQEHNQFNNEQLIQVLFQSLFNKKILFQLEQNCKIYSLFKDKEQFQQTTLFCIEQLCEKEED